MGQEGEGGELGENNYICVWNKVVNMNYFFKSKAWGITKCILYLAAFVYLLMVQFPIRPGARHYVVLGLVVLCIVLKLIELIRIIMLPPKSE